MLNIQEKPKDSDDSKPILPYLREGLNSLVVLANLDSKFLVLIWSGLLAALLSIVGMNLYYCTSPSIEEKLLVTVLSVLFAIVSKILLGRIFKKVCNSIKTFFKRFHK